MMKKRAVARLGALGLIVGLSACGGGSGDGGNGNGGGPKVKGAAAKGPFVANGTISVSPADGSGAASGKASEGKTNARGEFEFSLGKGGLVLATADGHFYDELTGKVSGSSVSLKAYASLKGSGSQKLFINTVTHLTSARVQTLLAGGTVAAEAIGQADEEIDAALGIAVSTWSRSTPGTGLDLLAGDTEESAYAAAVGAVMLQVAEHRVRAGAGASSIQEVLDEVAADFADDGLLEEELRAEIDRARLALPVDRIETLLAEHLGVTGTEAKVPALDRILDDDGDGIANLFDNCPLIPNPDQGKVTGLCDARLSNFAVPNPQASSLQIGDLDGNGDPDLVVAASGKLYSWISTAPLQFPASPVEASVNWKQGDLLFVNFRKPVEDPEAPAGDFNLDLIGGQDVFDTIQLGDGAGQFGSTEALLEFADIGPVPFHGFEQASVVDIDADGRPDIVGIFGGVQLTWSRGRPSGSFARPKNAVRPVANEIDRVLFASWPGVPDPEGEVGPNGELPMKMMPSFVALGRTAFAVAELSEEAGVGTRGGHEALDNTPTYSSPAIGDFNGDGKVDVAYLSTSDDQGTRVVTWIGDDSSRKFGFGPRFDISGGSVKATLHAADLDGDGKTELLLATASGGKAEVRILSVSGNTLTPVHSHGFAMVDGELPLIAGDIDGDGIVDLAWLAPAKGEAPAQAQILRLSFDSVEAPAENPGE